MIELDFGDDPCIENPLTRFATLLRSGLLESTNEISMLFDPQWLNPQFVKRVLESMGFICMELRLRSDRVTISCRGMKNKADKPNQK